MVFAFALWWVMSSLRERKNVNKTFKKQLIILVFENLEVMNMLKHKTLCNSFSLLSEFMTIGAKLLREAFGMKSSLTHCLSHEKSRILTHNIFCLFFVNHKNHQTIEKGWSTFAFSMRRKKQEALHKELVFSSLATEKFLFVSFLFFSQRETAIHIHTRSQWSNVHEFVLKENK